MTQPYIGEVRMFGGNFAPLNWAFCNGETMPISQYDTLFTLIGTTYGGDGTTTFNLPNLQGRLAVGTGQGPGLSAYTIGQIGGTESVTLNANTMPSHSHVLAASTTLSSLQSPTNSVTGSGQTTNPVSDMYTTPTPNQTGNLNQQSCANSGGNQPHPNLMPSLCVSFIIALFGIFPTQS